MLYIFFNSKICKNKNIYTRTRPNNLKLCTVHYNSKYLIDRLISLGVVPRKTGIETMEHVPDEYKLDFVRGYFDGDGSISISESKNKTQFNCNICGTSLNILEQIQSLFNFGIIRPQPLRTTTSIQLYIWQVKKKSDLEVFRNLIYQTGSFCLQRKKDKLFAIDTVYQRKPRTN